MTLPEDRSKYSQTVAVGVQIANSVDPGMFVAWNFSYD